MTSWRYRASEILRLRHLIRLEGLLALGTLASVARPAGGVEANLADRGDVDHVVHPPVLGPREPVAVLLTGRRVQRCRARPGREPVPAGYPMLRLLTIIACGSRTVIDAVFGSYRTGETTYAPRLADSLRPGMVLLGDRNFAAAALIEQFAATGADLLIRCKDNRRLAILTHLRDGTSITALGGIHVRVIDAQITLDLGHGGRQHASTYRLITTLTDPVRYPAREVVALYHQRWEIETSFRETKSTILDGRVLRARTPTRDRPGGLRRPDRAPGTADRDRRYLTGQRAHRPRPAQLHHRRDKIRGGRGRRRACGSLCCVSRLLSLLPARP